MSKFEYSIAELADKKYKYSKYFGVGTACFTSIIFIFGVIDSWGRSGYESTLSGGVALLSLFTSIMLFVTYFEMRRFTLRAYLKKQVRVCKTHFSLTLGYLALVSITGLSTNTKGAIIALLFISIVVTPLYFIANTALDFAEESVDYNDEMKSAVVK